MIQYHSMSSDLLTQHQEQEGNKNLKQTLKAFVVLSGFHFIFSLSIFLQDFPSKSPCDLSVLQTNMMLWMLYDCILSFLIGIICKFVGTQPNNSAPKLRWHACLWIGLLYLFMQVSMGLALFKTNNECTLLYHPHPLLIAVFVHWIYRFVFWLGFFLCNIIARAEDDPFV